MNLDEPALREPWLRSDARLGGLLPPRYDHHDSLLQRAAAPGPIRNAALRAWRAIARDPSRAGFSLQHHLRRGTRGLRSWERRLLAAGLYALVRGHTLFTAITGDARPRTLWLAWLVHQGLDASRATSFAHGVDLRPCADLLSAARDALGRRQGASALSLAAALPERVTERLCLDLGGLEAAADFLAASNQRAPLVLRVNTALTTREAVLERLRADGVEATPSAISPLGVRVARCNIRRHPVYAEGRVEIQDDGSQAVTRLLEPQPGERLLDLCAGAGGKTLELAAAVGETGQITAWDTRRGRLEDLRERAERSRVLERIEIADAPPEGHYDGVLVDAPCTGSGTLRREPTLRWRLDEARLEAMVEAQDAVLDEGAARTRPGGRLLYVTCSVFRRENAARVEAFLERHPEFMCEARRELGPHTHDTDGFFAARLRRR